MKFKIRTAMIENGICNAKIHSVSLGIENHGILTFDLYLHFDSCHYMSFGNISLGGQDGWEKERNICGRIIFRILEVLEKRDYVSLKGTPLRMKMKNGRIVAIGNFIDDKWFYLSEVINEI